MKIKPRQWARGLVMAFRAPFDRFHRFAPPGHYYSPVPHAREVKRDWNRLFSEKLDPPLEIDLNEKGQLQLLEKLKCFYGDLPFQEKRTPGLRYRYQNPAYGHTDAIFLYSVMREFRPERIIEIGCGYSSCVILDTNEKFLDGKVNCTFVEPYPKLLLSLLKPEDEKKIRIIPQRVQEVDLAVFSELKENDILFIDSSHVSKLGSDVNYLYFEILPRLKPGVLIHIHDIFYPFEYPPAWIEEGRAWNEAYLLRALLMGNSHYQIQLFSIFLHRYHSKFFEQQMPLCLSNPGGNLWLRKMR